MNRTLRIILFVIGEGIILFYAFFYGALFLSSKVIDSFRII